jgi:biotin operon repressor
VNGKLDGAGRRKLVEEIGRFVAVPHVFIESYSHGLSVHARWLFVVLLYFVNHKTCQAFPSYDTLQRVTGYRRQAISKALRELEKTGWVVRHRRFGRSTIYKIKIPYEAQCLLAEQGHYPSKVFTTDSIDV